MSDEQKDVDGASERPQRLSTARLIIVLAPLLVFLGLGAVLGARLFDSGLSAIASFERRPAPTLDIAALEGDGRLTRSTLTSSGDVVIVNFWFSFCPPCQEEHPRLLELARMDGVTVYGVAVKPDTPDLSRAYLQRRGDPFAMAGFDETGSATVAWGVRGSPETFILTPDGEIVYRHTGVILPEHMDSLILPAIEAARAGADEPQS